MGGKCGKSLGKGKEFYAGKSSKFDSNEFKEVVITPGHSVIVARVLRKIRVISSKCPHCGASLADGVYFSGRIRCPVHGSCYDLVTGYLEDFPGIDSIPTYPVKESCGSVFVYPNPNALPTNVMRTMKKMKKKSNITTVIIGSGAAGFICAQTLREEGYNGRLIMVTKESFFPYDRTKLSKTSDLYLEELLLRDEQFYTENDIEVLLKTEVMEADLRSHKLYFDETNHSRHLEFDNLVIATGLFNLHFDPISTPGRDLKNIQHIYKLQDAVRLYEKVKGKTVLIAGSSFLAMEMAQTLMPLSKRIIMLSRNKAPYGIVLGETVANALLAHLKNNAPDFHFITTDECRKFVGNEKGEVIGAITAKKRHIKCDFVLIAYGGLPNTTLFQSQGLDLRGEDGAIVVNKYMETNIVGVYAAGDCCCFPFHLTSDESNCVPHWQAASMTGKIAALNILGKGISSMDIVPFYTAKVLDVPIQYVGFGEHYDDVDIFGSLEKLKFCAVYYRHKKLTAVCAVGCDTLGVELLMILEDDKSWVDCLPQVILDRFPEPPSKGEVLHRYITHHELHTKEWFDKQDVIGMIGKPKTKFEAWKISEKGMVSKEKKEVEMLSPFPPPEYDELEDFKLSTNPKK